MNPSTSPSQYLLLFRGPDWDRGLSTPDAQHLLDRVMAWIDDLQARGLVKGGQPLARRGTVVSGSGERTFDGPFAESKEVVGGYLLVEVEDFEAAVAIARDCPTIANGIDVEVRPVLEACPVTTRLLRQRELATA